ncbi:MAG: MFS transporter [Candidatus Helarchaeota archaeon]
MLLHGLKKYHQIFSYLFLIMMIIGGGVLNLKFVQLGIPELGLDILKLDEFLVVILIFLMGLSALLSCIFIGWILDKLEIKFNSRKILFIGLSVINILLIYLTDFVYNEITYSIWVICYGINLGVSAGISYPFIFYLIPQKKRGFVAGLLVGAMYLIGASSPENWSFTTFKSESLIFIPFSIIFFLFYLIFDVFDLEKIKKNADLGPKFQINIKLIILIMSFILFADSFGFLRVINTPMIFSQTWQSTIYFRIYIGVVHFISALIIGYFYDKLKFINMALISATLIFVSDFIMGYFLFNEVIRYLYPLLYASGISTYTVILMAMISDISSEETINKNIGIGFGFLGWFCTYFATSSSFYLMFINFPFNIHLIITSFIAIIPILIGIFIKIKYKSNEY